MNKHLTIRHRTFGLPPPVEGVPAQPQGDWWLFNSMGTGLDGVIYCGLCDHRFVEEGALLIAYDPRDDSMRTLANMQDVCGQRGRGDLHPQSKVHTPFIADRDGRVYFGTHSCERDYAPPDLQKKYTGGYPGGHWMRYDPRARRCESLGIAVAGESLMGFALESRTRKLYATTHTKSLLISYDIASGRTEIIGDIGKFPTRTVECAADGRVFTFNEEGRVVRYDPRARELRVLDTQLPGYTGDVNFLTPLVTVLARDGRTIYGLTTAFHQEPREPMAERVEGRTTRICPQFAFAYDTMEGADGRMRTLGPAGGAEDVVVSDMHLLHSIALAQNGDALYVVSQKDAPAHLMRIDASSGVGHERLRDCGEMWCEDQSEGYFETALAATTGLDGTIYFAGPRKSEKHPRDATRWVLAAVPRDSWL
jgi:hypothetical protein